MDKTIIIMLIGLVCVSAPPVSGAGCVPKVFKCSSGVDFDAFNKWLMKSLEGVDDVGLNLAHVRSNLNQLASSKVRRTAEIFVDFMEAQKCDVNLLTNAKEIFQERVNLHGPKRVERLLGSRLDFITESCGRYLDDTVQEIYNRSLQTADIGRFLEVVVLRPHKWQLPIGGPSEKLSPEPDRDFYSYISEHHNRTLNPSPATWANYLAVLGWDDVNAIVTEKVLDKVKGRYEFYHRPENFKYAYDRYLVRPCKTLTSSLGCPFIDVYGLSQSEPSFVSHRSATVKQLLYGFKVCEALLALHPLAKHTIHLWARL